MRNTLRTSLVRAITIVLLVTPVVLAQHGRFPDPLELRDTGNGLEFTLLGPFSYVDTNNVTWIVPSGARVNGASIPRPLWTLIGGPWDGKYRRASVIHDYFFWRRRYSSVEVHRVFYEAMLTDGVAPLQAKLMYWAVLRFNPRWYQTEVDPYDCNNRQVRGVAIRCMPAPIDDPGNVVAQVHKTTVPWNEDDFNAMRQRLELSAADVPLATLERDAREQFDDATKTSVLVCFLTVAERDREDGAKCQ